MSWPYTNQILLEDHITRCGGYSWPPFPANSRSILDLASSRQHHKSEDPRRIKKQTLGILSRLEVVHNYPNSACRVAPQASHFV